MKRKNKQRVTLVCQPNRMIRMRYTDEQGKRQFKSTGTTDSKLAEEIRARFEAELTLGVRPRQAARNSSTKNTRALGLDMSWSDFRDEYATQCLKNKDKKGAADCTSRLDLATRILKPVTVRDVADQLGVLMNGLRDGEAGRFKEQRKRSWATVKSTLRTVVAALNWGRRVAQLWPERFECPPPPVEVEVQAKGVPLSDREFERMLKAIPKVEKIGANAKAAHAIAEVMHAARNTGLRLEELMGMTWAKAGTIRPIWPKRKGDLPMIEFPANKQKNRKSQTIPMSPWFEKQLKAIPTRDRSGFIFSVPTVDKRRKGKRAIKRVQAVRVGKLVSEVGVKSGVIVKERDDATDTRRKFASMHDLRRTFAQRLVDDGVPVELARKMLRHADVRTTERYYLVENTQHDANELRKYLG